MRCSCAHSADCDRQASSHLPRFSISTALNPLSHTINHDQFLWYPWIPNQFGVLCWIILWASVKHLLTLDSRLKYESMKTQWFEQMQSQVAVTDTDAIKQKQLGLRYVRIHNCRNCFFYLFRVYLAWRTWVSFADVWSRMIQAIPGYILVNTKFTTFHDISIDKGT